MTEQINNSTEEVKENIAPIQGTNSERGTQMTTQNENTTSSQPVAPTAPVSQSEQVVQNVANGNEPKKPAEPVKIDRLAGNENFTFTDANGYEWQYTFQFPGIRKINEMLDNSKMGNGVISNTIYWQELLDNVVIEPRRLDLDDFDTRPGLTEVMDAADTFCGKKMSIGE